MKVLIIGATGETGKLIIDQCIDKGFDVSAFARTPSKLDAFHSINIIHGDILDYSSLKKAVIGKDLVICAVGVPMGQKIDNSRSKGTSNLIKAMKAANLSRLIAISTIGVGSSRQNMNLVSKCLYPLIVGKARLLEAQKQEDLIMRSNLEWTIVRPPRLVTNNNKVNIDVSDNLKTTLSDTLPRCNLAELVVDLSHCDTYINKAVTVVGR